MSESDAEAELMRRLCERDPQPLATIYDRYARVVYSLFFRITHDQAAAEDLVQELFLRLWNRARQFNSNRGNLGVWLLSIARNMAFDYVRSARAQFAKRWLRVELIDQFSGPASSTQSGSMIENAERVAIALLSLPPRERQVLELAYFEGYSQSEIANRLQETVGTVKSRMRSAFTRLRLDMDGAPTLNSKPQEGSFAPLMPMATHTVSVQKP